MDEMSFMATFNQYYLVDLYIKANLMKSDGETNIDKYSHVIHISEFYFEICSNI